jgi:hypothetical protein
MLWCPGDSRRSVLRSTVFFFAFLSANAADKPACQPVSSQLDGWYDFAGSTGPSPGVAGFGGDALWVGSPVPVEGRSALRFETGNYLEVSNPGAYDYPTQDFTVSGWVRSMATATVFLDKRCPGGAAGCGTATEGWALGVSPGGQLQVLLASAAPYFYEGFTAFNLKPIHDGEWHFIAASIDRTRQRLLLFVDHGEPQIVSLEGYRGPIPSRRPLRMGNFAGELDEAQMFNRALQGPELAAIAAAGPDGLCRPPACSPLSTTATLVAWYGFDEEAGPLWSDRAGQNHYLTGAAAREAGQAGAAVTFKNVEANGGLRTATVPSDAELGERDLTLSTWVRYAPGDGRRAILDLPGSYTLLLADGAPRFELAPNSAYSAATRVDDGLWHHLAAVFEQRPATVRLLIDGEPVTATQSESTVAAAKGILRVGAFATEPSATQGSVDELAIFRAALPDEEIRSIFQAASSTFCRRDDHGCIAPPAGLLTWYRFEQAEGAFEDAGAAPNEPLLLSSASLRAPGRIGAGLRFRDAGTFGRTLGAPAKLNFDAAFTLSLWIRPISTGTRTIVEKMTLPGEGYRLRFAEGNLEVTLGGQSWRGGPVLVLDQWSHVALVATPGEAPVLVVNGRHETLTGDRWSGRAASGNRLLVGASADPVLNAAERGGFDLDELSFYSRALSEVEWQALAIAGQCSTGEVSPARPVFEVRTQPENLGVSVGIGGESPAMNHYATTTSPSMVTAPPGIVPVGANTEYRFRNWSVNGFAEPAWTALSQAVPALAASATYTANYDTYYRLTVNVTGGCTVTPAAGFYLRGSELPLNVTLPAGTIMSATLNTGAASIAVANRGPLVISAPAVLEVNCRGAVVSVTVATFPANVGLSVMVDNIPLIDTQTFSWTTGTARTLAVPLPVQAVGGTQYTFRRWRNSTSETTIGTTPSVQVTPSAPAHYLAEFDRTGYRVELRQPAGCQIVPSPPLPASGFYAPGTRITFNLVPSPGSKALTLTVTAGNASAPRTGPSPLDYNIDNPIIVTGQCQAEEVQVNFYSYPPSISRLSLRFVPSDGSAALTSQGFQASLQVRPGTLTLTAPPNATDFTGYYRLLDITPGNFASGAAIPAPTFPTTYVARYDLLCFYVTSQAYPLSSGSVSVTPVSGPPSPTYRCYTGGSVVTLTARPNPGYEFQEWIGIEAAGSANPLTYRVPNTIAIPGARFRKLN